MRTVILFGLLDLVPAAQSLQLGVKMLWSKFGK